MKAILLSGGMQFEISTFLHEIHLPKPKPVSYKMPDPDAAPPALEVNVYKFCGCNSIGDLIYEIEK